MFVGEYQSALGIPKNRVSLPTKIYSLLTNRQVVLSKGFDRCIVGYEVKAQKMRKREDYDGLFLQTPRLCRLINKDEP